MVGQRVMNQRDQSDRTVLASKCEQAGSRVDRYRPNRPSLRAYASLVELSQWEIRIQKISSEYLLGHCLALNPIR